MLHRVLGRYVDGQRAGSFDGHQQVVGREDAEHGAVAVPVIVCRVDLQEVVVDSSFDFRNVRAVKIVEGN